MLTLRPLNVALLGCSAVSELYYKPALKALEKTNVVWVRALFDPNSARLAQLNKSFPSAIRIGNLSELPRLDIELAIIASPPSYHAEQAIRALKYGVSVLCEKPMAVSVAEGEAMIEAAGVARRDIAIGLERRFFPATKGIREMVSSEMLGKVRSFYFSEGGIFRWPVQCKSFFEKGSQKGGVLLDIGVHVLDMLIWWLGYPEKVLYEDDAIGGVEANCRIKLWYPRGVSGEVRLSRDYSVRNRYVVECTKGWLGWNVNEGDKIEFGLHDSKLSGITRVYENGFKNIYAGKIKAIASLGEAFISQICNVVAAIHGTSQLVVPGDQGLPSLRLIEHCYDQRTLMDMPWLGEREYAQALQISKQSS